jgi:hypothetical protein
MLTTFAAGNYRFVPNSARPFSSGAVADPGYDLVRATFLRPPPLAEGLQAAGRHVEAAGRPTTAIAAFELRIPAQLTEAGFAEFNAGYLERLAALGLVSEAGPPAARTNVAPSTPGVAEPVVHAFTYTVPGDRATPAFRLSGVPERTREGALRDRLRTMTDAITEVLRACGLGWGDATAASLYAAAPDPLRPEHGLVDRLGEIALRGITWYPSAPPVAGLEFELDLRRVGSEIAL